MAKQVTIRKDMIPYRAGVVVLTPLDSNFKPDFSKSVPTQYDFLTSTQTSVTRTTETLANGNGSDKDYIIDERYSLAVVGNTYDPEFHAAVTNRLKKEETTVTLMDQFSVTLPENANGDEMTETGKWVITFGEVGKDQEKTPAKNADGGYDFVINDSYGNTLHPVDNAEATTEVGTYYYDGDKKCLVFGETYKNNTIRVIFFYEVAEGGLQYDSNPILKQSVFRIDVFGMRQSAGSDDLYPVHIWIERASTSGDVSEQTTQKSKSAPITYNFQSDPVPAGVSVYHEVYGPAAGNSLGG